jgi:hypothetical protein
MELTLGGWLTLILGGAVIYGGLIICLMIANKKRMR